MRVDSDSPAGCSPGTPPEFPDDPLTAACPDPERANLAHLCLRLDLETWKCLNAGELSAPEAFLRRRVHLEGNLALAVKLHLILG